MAKCSVSATVALSAASKAGHDTISSPTHSINYTLDAEGNFASTATDGGAAGPKALLAATRPAKPRDELE